MNPTQYVEKLFELVQIWHPRAVCIEEVVFSSVYSHWIKREMLIRNCRFSIIPYKPPKDKVKFERVAVLGNRYAAGQIYFRSDQRDIIWEFDNFGATDNYHLHDALAQGEEFWIAPMSREEEKQRAEEMDERLDAIDPSTGYSDMYGTQDTYETQR